MRYRLRHRTVPFRMSALALLCAATLGGCVSADTHKKALAELEAAKKLTAQQQMQLTGMRDSLDSGGRATESRRRAGRRIGERTGGPAISFRTVERRTHQRAQPDHGS